VVFDEKPSAAQLVPRFEHAIWRNAALQSLIDGDTQRLDLGGLPLFALECTQCGSHYLAGAGKGVAEAARLARSVKCRHTRRVR